MQIRYREKKSSGTQFWADSRLKILKMQTFKAVKKLRRFKNAQKFLERITVGLTDCQLISLCLKRQFSSLPKTVTF